MKSVLFFATAALAATGTLNKRQISVVTSAIAQVSSSVASLNSAVQGFQGLDQVTSLTNAAKDTLSVIQSANSAISPIGVLPDTDAGGLVTPIQSLAALVDTASKNVIAKKSTFDSVQVGSVVLQNLTQLRDAAGTLSATILSKVSTGLQAVGKPLADQITASLNTAVQAYSDETAPTGGATSAASSATSVAATTASATGPSYGTTAPATTGSAAPTAVYTTSSRAATTGAVSTYKGAANNGGSYGAAAMAALAVAAMF